MPVNVQDVLTRASRTLTDVDQVRWTHAVKLTYFNDGLLEIAVQKPSAFARTIEIQLVAGTLQTVPDQYSSLIRVTRNIKGAAGASQRVGGRSVTPARRDIINDQYPDWHDPDNVPFSRNVQHVMADEFEPRQFYVFPGNNGSGLIEAIVGLMPARIASPITAGTTAPLDLIYFNALHDYVVYRCYAEDMILNGAGQRAQAHYGLFQSALGIRQDIEGVANVNTTNGAPQ